MNKFQRTGIILSFLTGSCIILLSLLMGKSSFFLLLNGNGGTLSDLFFSLITHAGEEILWILFFIFLLLKKRKYLPLYFAHLTISTFLVQICKRVLLTDTARPIEFLAKNIAEIHTVANVELHHWGSFPSGHTSSAFTLWLMLCCIFPARFIFIFGFFIAVCVGYSRIYLSQHFPVDVGAGMIIAAITSFLSWYVQVFIDKKKQTS